MLLSPLPDPEGGVLTALPDPDDVKGLMSAMSYRVSQIVGELVQLAVTYGIHGQPLTFGQFTFQLTRVTEKWSVYISSDGGPPRDLLGTRLDEKLLFLECAEEFDKAYQARIISLYDRLRTLAKNTLREQSG